jgi:hypothetical protein
MAYSLHERRTKRSAISGQLSAKAKDSTQSDMQEASHRREEAKAQRCLLPQGGLRQQMFPSAIADSMRMLKCDWQQQWRLPLLKFPS